MEGTGIDISINISISDGTIDIFDVCIGTLKCEAEQRSDWKVSFVVVNVYLVLVVIIVTIVANVFVFLMNLE